MSDDQLYFISIIARALQSPDIEKALRDAFREIKKKGREERYGEGFRNFKLFMQKVYNRYQVTATYYIREMIALLGTGMFEDPVQEKKLLLNIINSHPELKAEYEAFYFMEDCDDLTHISPVIQVIGEKDFVKELTFAKVPTRESIYDVVPGNYKIELVNTGWVIWEGELAVRELIWIALPMAAKTKGIRKKPTREIDLLKNGDMILRTYSGKEKGHIEIELIR